MTNVVLQFTVHNAPQLVIRARGKFISKAVDIAEVAAKRFLENQVTVSEVKIGSEEFKNEEGRNVRVSSIDITLSRKQP